MDANGSAECSVTTQSLEKYYLSIMYASEFVLGITGNSIVVFGYIFCLKNWKSGNIYLFNLTLSDFAFLCTLPWLVSSYSKGKWSYDSTWCQANRFLLHANLYSSILFLTLISIDRYLLMKYPFRNHFLQKRRTAIVFSVAIWIVVILELSPMFIFITFPNTDDSQKCIDYASSGDAVQSLIYSMSLTFFGFLIPMCVMCFFYMKTLSFLKSRNLQPTATVALEKPLTLVVMAVCIFSVLFTPYHIMRNVRIASRTQFWKLTHCTCVQINIAYLVTRPFAFLNSVINPIFYFLMGDHFRDMLMSKVRDLIKRFIPCCKSG
ncbi:succinate receptor 1 isoform X2 [Hemicordylus capensis]|uniref:succinate receptor 1 isoform X2 n=1 Tax=Hemicordylus capensis TaxID=884348 RepID=UPI0023045346|nr:succinate receptor 1 isoform X2 [Hemicordylus capensis]XP_053160220.1 succinate receptor 1 isoform X2 [Hemicordylus capensis]XP_053160221.1 succinate receptor 1 isoform X2 [Hemicordylus capensis]XP_053160222.1 succinate receptor 1 isoform X2 [Hemicordylus capensis]